MCLPPALRSKSTSSMPFTRGSESLVLLYFLRDLKSAEIMVLYMWLLQIDSSPEKNNEDKSVSPVRVQKTEEKVWKIYH